MLISIKNEICNMSKIPSLLATIRQRSVALQGIIASIPFFIYFRDDFYSIAYVRGTSMEPTLHHGDVILLRKRDAGNILLRFLHNIGFLKPSSAKSENNRNLESNEELKSESSSMTTSDFEDNDLVQALKYRLEDDNNTYWLISSSHTSPIVLPGHVVAYRNPYQFQELLVKRVIGIGGQRIATTTTPPPTRGQQHRDNEYRENVNIEAASINQNTPSQIATNKDDVMSSSDHSFLLEYLRLREQLEQNDFNYYNLRLPPHFVYTEGDNVKASQFDSRYKHQPVSQNLIVGIAEYILWPPSRFQRIIRQPAYERDSNDNRIVRPRAIWDK